MANNSIIIDIWAKAIINGNRTYSRVPRLLKEEVAEALRNYGHEELIDKID